MRCYEYFLSHRANNWVGVWPSNPSPDAYEAWIHGHENVFIPCQCSANNSPIFSNCIKYFLDQLVNNFLLVIYISPAIIIPYKNTNNRVVKSPNTTTSIEYLRLLPLFLIFLFFSIFPPLETIWTAASRMQHWHKLWNCYFKKLCTHDNYRNMRETTNLGVKKKIVKF